MKNDIHYIHPNIIDHLNNLNVFKLDLNRCISDTYSIGSLQKLKKSIADYCQNVEKPVEKAKIKSTEIKKSKYFWILVVCGVISALFFIFAGVVFVRGAVKVCKK